MQDIVKYLAEHTGEKYIFSVRVPEHYSRINQSHASRIGLVKPELASRIIEFHQLIDALVQDISDGGLVSSAGGDIKAFENMVLILESAISIGNELIHEGQIARS